MASAPETESDTDGLQTVCVTGACTTHHSPHAPLRQFRSGVQNINIYTSSELGPDDVKSCELKINTPLTLCIMFRNFPVYLNV